jgi:hypothetical protein
MIIIREVPITYLNIVIGCSLFLHQDLIPFSQSILKVACVLSMLRHPVVASLIVKINLSNELMRGRQYLKLILRECTTQTKQMIFIFILCSPGETDLLAIKNQQVSIVLDCIMIDTALRLTSLLVMMKLRKHLGICIVGFA